MWDFVVVLVLMKCALINVLTLKVQSWGFTSGLKARNILDSFLVLIVTCGSQKRNSQSVIRCQTC